MKIKNHLKQTQETAYGKTTSDTFSTSLLKSFESAALNGALRKRNQEMDLLHNIVFLFWLLWVCFFPKQTSLRMFEMFQEVKTSSHRFIWHLNFITMQDTHLCVCKSFQVSGSTFFETWPHILSLLASESSLCSCPSNLSCLAPKTVVLRRSKVEKTLSMNSRVWVMETNPTKKKKYSQKY